MSTLQDRQSLKPYTQAELQARLADLPRHEDDNDIIYPAPPAPGLIFPLISADFIKAAIIPHPDPEAFIQAVSATTLEECLFEENMAERFYAEGKLFRNCGAEITENNAFLDAVRHFGNVTGRDFHAVYPLITFKGKPAPEVGHMHNDPIYGHVHFTFKGGIEFLTGDVTDDEMRALLKRRQFEQGENLRAEWKARVKSTSPGDTTIMGPQFYHRTSLSAVEQDWVCNIVMR